MSQIIENNVIRFTRVTKKRDGIYANFKVKGIKGGTTFTANFAVEISDADVDLADSLEKIIEQCAKKAARAFKTSDLQFEGLSAI